MVAVDGKFDELAGVYEDIRRGTRDTSLRGLIKAADEEGLPLDLGDLQVLAERLGEGEYVICPDWIVSFFALVGREGSHASILDPGAGLGSIAAPLARKLHAKRAVAICSRGDEFRLAPLLNGEAGIEWVESDPIRYLEQSRERFDITATRIGRNQPGADDVLRAASAHLRDEGIAFVVVEEEPAIAAITGRLEHLQLHADSLLSISGGLVAIARKQPGDRLFVGVLGPDQGVQDILAKNITLRRSGKAPELGILLDAPVDQGVREVVLRQAIGERARDGGFSVVPFRTIAAEMHAYSADAGFPAGENTVYLPHTAALPVLRSSTETASPDDYVQVVLDPEVSAAYVARFFGTALGCDLLRLYELAAARGTYLEMLPDAPFPLPPAEVRAEVLEVAASLQQAKMRLDSLERDLWAHPFAADAVRKEVAGWIGEDEFERWIESLPFPVASILWAYRAETDDEHRVDHLFNFFEALGEFIALLMLSALGPLCVERGVDLLEDNPYFRDSYRYATFRAWTVLGRRLARHTRSLLSRPSTRSACLDAFGNPDPGFLDMISSKRLFAVLDDVADLRNLWKAHGGMVGPAEHERRREALEECLQRARSAIGRHFEPVLLLAPETSTYHEGIFRYEAQSLTGSHLAFRHVVVETAVPMDAGKIYLLSRGRTVPVQLLPLLKIMEVPETPARACYFYNRIEGEKVRWVSYHFGGAAEVLGEDDEVVDLLSSLGLIEAERGG